MISYLNGKIILKKEKFVVLDVGGVGYKVFLSRKAISKIPEIGELLKVFCFLDVKENSLNLYGFLDSKELEFFEILNDIHGIGPKAAIEISSIGPLESIKDRILASDERIFEGIPGIGKKRAMTIILELSGKIRGFSGKTVAPRDEAEEALINLGFLRQQAKEVLSKVPKDIKTVEEKVKEALKLLGK